MTGANVRATLGLVALVVAAMVLHGYHFGIEDQALYLPAALHALDPTLFPHDSAFFLTEARFTLFDELLALLLRHGPLPLDVLVGMGHVGALFLLLWSGRQLLQRLFADPSAEWMGLCLLVVVLPFPVAGTRLGLMEQYLHPRGAAIAVVLTAFVAALDRRVIALPLMAAAAALHPLTGLWGVVHVVCQAGVGRWGRTAAWIAVVVTVAGVTQACGAQPAWQASEATYWQVALTPELFRVRYPIHWPWYEWVGIVAPPIVLAYFASAGRRLGATVFASVTSRLVASTVVGIVLALAITAVPNRSLPLQPMRQLHLVYIVLMLVGGARIEQRFLKGRLGHRLAFGIAVVLCVTLLQRSFPFSPRIEWPGRVPDNPWVLAFDWARQHTPPDARFAIDPYYLRRAGPDSHSFRVFAQRSVLSDAIHDLAPAAMSPALAERWQAEQRDTEGWRTFATEDFERLAASHQVSWVVVAEAQARGLHCPYSDHGVNVCQLRSEVSGSGGE